MPSTCATASFLKELDFTTDELRFLLDLAARAQGAPSTQAPRSRGCAGKNIALIFEKTSTRTRCAFEVAAHDQGAHVTYLDPTAPSSGTRSRSTDTARVLGRMFDGIEYRGFAQDDRRGARRYAGVPVWNGLTDEWHPTQMLADILTMREHSGRRTRRDRLLLPRRRPQQHRQLAAGHRRAAGHGRPHRRAPRAVAATTTSSTRPRRSAETPAPGSWSPTTPPKGVRGRRLRLHRRVGRRWASPRRMWDERIAALLPYQVNAKR